jgi:hypothetical protein
MRSANPHRLVNNAAAPHPLSLPAECSELHGSDATPIDERGQLHLDALFYNMENTTKHWHTSRESRDQPELLVSAPQDASISLT